MPMKIERTLKKVGGSGMVPFPAEILRELRWGLGPRYGWILGMGLFGSSPSLSVRRTT